MNRRLVQGNGAAGRLTEDMVRESHRAVAERLVSSQEANTLLTQDVFNDIINNLRAQARSNRVMARQLTSQHKQAQEATQTLALNAVGVCMNFVNSMFSFYQGGVKRTGRSARPSSSGRTESLARNGKLPLENYDSLTAKEVIEKMKGLSAEDVELLRTHEVKNKDRRSVTDRFDARTEVIEAGLPVENYDSLNVVEVIDRMEELSVEEIRQLRSYETKTKNRPTLMKRFERS